VLSDLVRVEKRYRKCFEACLAPILKSVVAGSRRDAMSWLKSYRRGDAGRVQILFPDQFVTEGAPPRGPGVIGPAHELVDCDPAVSTFLVAYLEGVVVVEDVDTALSLIEAGGATRVATLDGVFFDGPGRVLVAGQDEIDATLLEMTAKMAELDRTLAAAEERDESLQTRRAALTEERERAQREIGAIRAALVTDEQAYEDLVASRRESELHLVRVKEKITALERGIEETRDAMLSLKPKFDSARRASGMPAAADLEGADLAALETHAVDTEREREGLAEEVGRLRLAEVSASAESQAHDTRAGNLAKLADELTALVRAREEDKARAEEQIRLSSEDIAAARASVSGLHQEKTTVEKRIEDASAAYASLKEARDALESEIRGMNDQRDVKRANIERVNVELAGVETRVASVIEKGREKFNQDLGEWVTHRDRFQPAEWAGVDRQELEVAATGRVRPRQHAGHERARREEGALRLPDPAEGGSGRSEGDADAGHSPYQQGGAPVAGRNLRTGAQQLQADLHHALRRRRSGPVLRRLRGSAGSQHQDRGQPARQEAARHFGPVVGERAGGALAVVRGLSQAEPVLRVRRSRRAPGRRQHRALRETPALVHRPHPVHRHHPQQEDDGSGRQSLWRHHGRTRRLEDHLRPLGRRRALQDARRSDGRRGSGHVGVGVTSPPASRAHSHARSQGQAQARA
jgi:hypothetical protein